MRALLWLLQTVEFNDVIENSITLFANKNTRQRVYSITTVGTRLQTLKPHFQHFLTAHFSECCKDRHPKSHFLSYESIL